MIPARVTQFFWTEGTEALGALWRSGQQVSMSEMTSSNRPGETSPVAGGEGAVVSDTPDSGSGGSLPLRDDQRTIISNRPPLASPGHGETEDRLEAGQFAAGDMLGPFELLEFIGGGGMGRVFRALDTQLSRVVALKVLPRDRAGDMETLLRFRNEARSAARLDHDNVVRVHHVGEDRSFPYVVFEYIEGETIRALVERDGPLPLADALSYTLQVADALAHAAERGVVHRDIKPSNIMITPDGRAKVIDLGLARLREVDSADSDLTASGVTLGTFDYISPEQARDPRTVDIRSDIYSLGCAFYYMLAGRPPFPEGTVLQKLLQHQGDTPPDLGQFRPELPEEVSQLARKMLAKDPNHRHQTPSELIEHLRRLAEQMGLRPTASLGGAWRLPRRRRFAFVQRHLPWMAPVAALLCIVTALHFLWSSPQDSQTAAGPHISAAPQASPAVEPAIPSQTTDSIAKPAPMPPESAIPTSPGLPPSPLLDKAAPTASVASAAPNAAFLPPDAVTSPLFDAGAKPGPSTASSSSSNEVIAALRGSADRGGSLFGGWNASDLLKGGVYGDAEPRPAADGGAAKVAGVLTVGDPAGGARNFATLAAACSAAESGDIIELRYNGRREERPISLPNARLTIRAGQGFQPVVAFRPNESDPIKYPRAMFSLTGSELALLNVAIELDIPRDVPADRWTLMELAQAETVRLEKSSLTIRNERHQEVAFFRVKASPASGSPGEEAATTPQQVASVALADCIVRGRAVVVRTESLQPVHFTWTNGLLLTSEQLLWAAGGDTMPRSGQDIRVQLKHLTALVGAGLCRMDNRQFAKYQLPTQVDCSDSILMATADRPLIEQVGERSLDQPRPLFTWSGDRNFYYGFLVFWETDDLRPETAAERLDFDAWRARWSPDHEIYSRWGRVDFARPPEATRPLDARTPNDYLLSDSVDNWARGTAADGTDVGFLAEQLPPLPSP